MDPSDVAIRRNVLRAGSIAWLLTVAVPCFQFSGTTSLSGWERTALWSAVVGGLGCLAAGASVWGAGWARSGLLYGFVGTCVAVWALGADWLNSQLGLLQGIFGAVAWLAYGLAWGAVRRPGVIPESDPHVLAGELLLPRRDLTRGTFAVFAFSLFGALATWLSAWRIEGRERGLLAHALSLGLAIAVLNVGAEAAIVLSREPASVRAQLSAAGRTAFALCALLGIGTYYFVVGAKP